MPLFHLIVFLELNFRCDNKKTNPTNECFNISNFFNFDDVIYIIDILSIWRANTSAIHVKKKTKTKSKSKHMFFCHFFCTLFS